MTDALVRLPLETFVDCPKTVSATICVPMTSWEPWFPTMAVDR